MSDVMNRATRQRSPMQKLSRTFLFTGSLLAVLLTGCTGGSSSTQSVGGASASGRCADTSSFCLLSCDLGCGSTGCQVTQVAENQRLQFRFNQPLAADSVNGSSFSIRTATGIAPDGAFQVAGNAITFVPSIRVTNGVSSFGFQRNESYIISLASGSQSVRSTSGGRLSREFTCTVTATLGIIDEDNAPPRATLVAPTNTASAPIDATFVLRFSEVIDTTPLQGTLTASSPIRFLLRRLRTDPVTQVVSCDRSGIPIVLEGIPRVSLENVNGRSVTSVSFKPNVNLPGLSCVQVQVTSDLRDLSGKQCVASDFEVFTENAPQQTLTLEETFATPARLDTAVSGGTWASGARPALVGGDGRHGSFDPTIGTTITTGIYEWNTDSFTIPGSRTIDGNPSVVTDGKFYFTDFIVPLNTTVRFTGNNPAQIYVRGRAEIRGRVESNGAAMTVFSSRQSNNLTGLIAGQNGGLAGAGGGRGGKGGDRCRGTGPTLVNGVPAENGANGGDAKVLATHAYAANTVNTGGRGSPMFPAHGVTTSLTGLATISLVYYGATASGGGGGGFGSAGVQGAVTVPAPPSTAPVGLQMSGTPNPGGVAFSLQPFPTTPGYQSLTHYLVGGAGGGGGGSHPLWGLNYNATSPSNPWVAGAGGSGGGGAFAVRAGGTVSVLPGAVLEAKGGAGVQFKGDDPNTSNVEAPNIPTSLFGVSSPGGGGSGGSVVLQSGGDLSMLGVIDTSGGGGSSTGGWTTSTAIPNIVSVGGRGSNGNYRIEAAGTVQVSNTGLVPTFDPAVNQGALADRDARVGCASLFRGSGLVFPPTWERYELEVDVNGDGSDVRIYSDDATVAGSQGPANSSLGPIEIKVQGARVNATTGQPEPGSLGPWRDFVNGNAGQSINQDASTGFRFQMIFNRDLFPNAIVRRFTVRARG